MKIVVTIFEETFERALDGIGGLAADHDAVELRAEEFGKIDMASLRRATAKPIILTSRGRPFAPGIAREAIEQGIDFVDIEFEPGLAIDLPRERVVLSHHDYEGMPEVEALVPTMRALGCAHTKLAVTPGTLDENFRLLALIGRGVTVIGMGERGLFSRILAPFLGSELAFVAAAASAAPGQLSLERALEIYGDERSSLHATDIFAIAGDPAGHSLSPAIHNRLFREERADAAYTIASFPEFEPLGAALAAGRIRGLSVTAPFKETALAFAESAGAVIAETAREAGAVNTLVRNRDGRLLADNTDVDGFHALIDAALHGGATIRSAAIVGAGGTARAALTALSARGITVRAFSRSDRQFPIEVEPLDRLESLEADLVINTLPADAAVRLPHPVAVYIEAAYPKERTVDASFHFSGIDLLHAQAVRQNQLFIEAIR